MHRFQFIKAEINSSSKCVLNTHYFLLDRFLSTVSWGFSVGLSYNVFVLFSKALFCIWYFFTVAGHHFCNRCLFNWYVSVMVCHMYTIKRVLSFMSWTYWTFSLCVTYFKFGPYTGWISAIARTDRCWRLLVMPSRVYSTSFYEWWLKKRWNYFTVKARGWECILNNSCQVEAFLKRFDQLNLAISVRAYNISIHTHANATFVFKNWVPTGSMELCSV